MPVTLSQSCLNQLRRSQPSTYDTRPMPTATPAITRMRLTRRRGPGACSTATAASLIGCRRVRAARTYPPAGRRSGSSVDRVRRGHIAPIGRFAEFVEAASFTGTMANRLTWLGHSPVLIDLDGTRAITDPMLRRRVAHLIRARKVADVAFGRGPLGAKSAALGYLLEGSHTVYVAGDTDRFEGMEGLAAGLDGAASP